MDDKLKKLYDKFMSYRKEDLAKLLATYVINEEDENDNLTLPYVSSIPFTERWINNRCKSWLDCTNPHRDCINCPLHNFYTPYFDGTIYTTTDSFGVEKEIDR